LRRSSHARLVLDEVRRRRVGATAARSVDLHVGEHLGVARVALEALTAVFLSMALAGISPSMPPEMAPTIPALEIGGPWMSGRSPSHDDDAERRVRDRVVEDLLALRRHVDVGEDGVEAPGLQSRQDPFQSSRTRSSFTPMCLAMNLPTSMS